MTYGAVWEPGVESDWCSKQKTTSVQKSASLPNEPAGATGTEKVLTGTFCMRFLFNFFRSYVESLVTFSLVTHFYSVHFNRKRAAVPVKSQVAHAPYHRVVEEVEGKQ